MDSKYELYGKNVLVKPIEEDRTAFEKLIMEDNEFRAQMTRWGTVLEKSKEVDLDVSIGDLIRFNSTMADYNEKEKLFIVSQEKILARKER